LDIKDVLWLIQIRFEEALREKHRQNVAETYSELIKDIVEIMYVDNKDKN